VTSFYQSLQAMSSFMRFSICATYCTLSCLTGQDNRKSDRFAVDERKAGESPDAFLRQGDPQLPAVRAVSGLPIDAVLPWETIR